MFSPPTPGIPQKRKYPMGSHYLGTSLRGAIPMLRQKEAHGQSTLGCPAASFCATICSRQDLIWALNLHIWAVLHLPSLLVCCIHRCTKTRIIMFSASKKIVSAIKKFQKIWLKFASWPKFLLFFRYIFFLILEKYSVPDISVLTLIASLYIAHLFWESLRYWSLHIQEIARCFLE